MNKTYQRINWQNEPSIATPLNEVNLNKVDYSLNEVDNRVITLDTTKANQSDLLQTVKTVTYNTTTGVFTFTFWNGTVVTADLNIEKIPVSFSMSPQGVITMTTADGTEYTADVSELIKTYSFVDSSEIDFTVTTDASGNKDVTASIKAGSITGEKLQPNYLADCVSAKQSAESARDNAAQSSRDSNLSSQDAEAWAVGERNGQPVPSSDPTYENNAKWWAEHGTGNSFSGLTDTNFTNLQNGQIAKYNSTTHKWENANDEGGLLPHLYIDSEAGSTVTVVAPDSSVITPTQISSGHWECDVPSYGVYTIHAVLNGDDAVLSLTVDDVKEYHITDSHYSYTLNVYAPTGSTIRVTATGETYTGTGAGSNPVQFALHQASTTYTIEVTYDGLERDTTITSSATSGGSGSKTIEFGTINLTLDEDLIGETIVMTNGTATKSKVADSTSMVFYPNTTGNWTISCEYEGETYYSEPNPVVVSSLSTPVSAEISLVHIPEGATVTPTDDIQTWLACANITDKSYTLLSEVLADRETFETLLRDSNACDYMARSTTWAGSSAGIVNSSDAMALLGKYDYACNALLSNATWASAIFNSNYFESVLNVKVPKMTSATTPSGEVIAPNQHQSYLGYYAFDQNTSTRYSPVVAGTFPDYVTYDFKKQVKIFKFSVMAGVAGSIKDFQIRGSNDNSTWTTLYSGTYPNSQAVVEDVLTTVGNYRYYQIYEEQAPYLTYFSVAELQFYGRASSNVSNTNGIIHTAMGNESVYCVETGDTYTATDGIATVDFSDFDEGVYTFGSTTAKNPNDLSQDYTKQFRITKSPYGGTTELYLMPDTVKTLYWYGWDSGLIEDCVSANGWSWSGVGLGTPTHNTNDITLSSAIEGVKSIINGTHKIVVEGVTAVAGGYGMIGATPSKAISGSDWTEVVTSGKLLASKDISNKYAIFGSVNGRSSKIYAWWYE